MIAEFLVLVALPALLAAAAGWDLASFTIPNRLQLALLATFMLFVAASGMTLAVLGWHLVAGLVGLAIGFALFAAGWIGGGDAKLFAATALWLGFRDMMPYAVIASVFGGVLTLGLLVLRGWPLPAAFARYPWIMRLHDRRSGIPYGVALAAGVFFLLPQTDIFRLAAGA
ncbi:MAG: peptidase [Alphaproteobacteria bacterium 64-11]|nr:prepilin peptidase [Alphaproteobacteria bacterium]OJU08052.1 MAG: peptidase [Alphaproteobacteria bacterium 64-11]